MARNDIRIRVVRAGSAAERRLIQSWLNAENPGALSLSRLPAGTIRRPDRLPPLPPRPVGFSFPAPRAARLALKPAAKPPIKKGAK